MTPLDHLSKLSIVQKDVLSWLDDHLPLIVGVPIVLFILLGVIWTWYIAPRRARRILESMAAKGYSPLRPDDPQLLTAVRRLTPLIYTSYEESSVEKKGPWRVEQARFCSHSGRIRFIARISRMVYISTPQVTRTDRDFSVVFLETGRLPVDKEVHVVGDGYRIDPAHGVQKVEAALDAPLLTLFDFYTEDGTLAAFPLALQEALRECSPFLSLHGSRKKSDSYLFHARLKFTPDGWGLISDEFAYDTEKMEGLMQAAEKISGSLF